jgi:adenylate cyclase
VHGRQRRLAAILAADVAGYSRLMHADEEGALRSWATCRDLIETLVAEERGRIFHTAGDGIVAEFHSAVEAVRCAVRIQRAVERHNKLLAPERRMRFRIGVNLGDILVDDGNLFGDGVNIAARLEQMAPVGGVLLSGSAFDQVQDRLGYRFAPQGLRQLRHIDRPVRVYRVLGRDDPPPGRGGLLAGSQARRVAGAALAAVVVLALGGGLWVLEVPRAVVGVLGIASPVVPATPSIAVLPFQVLAGDEDLERFAGGLVDGVVTELARFPELLVLGRASTGAYDDQPHDARLVGRDLGVRFLLGGSLDRDGDRLKLRAHLIEAASGYTVWAESYEEPWSAFFDVQAELTRTIVASLGGWDSQIVRAERQRLREKPTESLVAYEWVLRAAELFERYTLEDNLQAREAALGALELDPRYAKAHAYVAWTYMAEFWWAWSDDPEAAVAEALAWGRRAVAADPLEYNAHWALGDAWQGQGEWDRAHAAYERALSLNGNDPELLQDYGSWILPIVGRAEEGIAHTRRAMRLNPRHPERYAGNLAFNYLLVGRFRDAVEAVGRMGAPRFDHRLYAAAALIGLGEEDAARSEVAAVLAERPDMTVERFLATLPFRDPADGEELARALEQAGLPPRAPAT